MRQGSPLSRDKKSWKSFDNNLILVNPSMIHAIYVKKKI